MSALMLRVIACVAMLMDHIGYQYGIAFFRIIGRIAFPIYVYLICNGYRHTSNRLRYALRLGIFAMIAQVPFALYSYGRFVYSDWNVMVTLLLGLLCIWTADAMLKKPILRWFSPVPALLICALYYFGFIESSYGSCGVIMAMVFHFADGKTIRCRFLMIAGVVLSIYHGYGIAIGLGLLKSILGIGNFVLPTVTAWSLKQAYALLALIFIFAYNGEKGKYPQNRALAKACQYGFYAFYPVHLLILWLIR